MLISTMYFWYAIKMPVTLSSKYANKNVTPLPRHTRARLSPTINSSPAASFGGEGGKGGRGEGRGESSHYVYIKCM